MQRSALFAIVFGVSVTSPLFAQTEKPALPQTRLQVGRTGGPLGGTLQSEQIQQDGRTVLHGLQVCYGPQLQIKEYSVYNDGRCEQLVQFYANGNVFREQSRDHEGSGSEALYSPEENQVIAEKVLVDGGQDIGPIKRPERICFGRVKTGKCWEGSFLIRELQGFQLIWMLQEYQAGKLVSSKPFPLEKLGLTAEAVKDEKWGWSVPDWPRVP